MTSHPDSSVPYVVEMLMVDGRPDGLRVVTMDNWTGTGIAFRRFDIDKARARVEMAQAGVYVLIGPDDVVDGRRLYIGEADDLRKRLAGHSRPTGKDFWVSAIAFTSAELNKAHARWLEAQLVVLAMDSGRAILENATAPTAQRLSEADETRVRTFLSRVLQILPLLGVDELDGSATEAPPGDAVAVTLTGPGCTAQGRYSSEGLRVLVGSTARGDERPSIKPHMRAARRRLQEAGVLVAGNGGFTFTRDHLFDSPSAAAAVLLGGAANGQKEWKMGDGRPVGDLRQQSDVHGDAPLREAPSD